MNIKGKLQIMLLLLMSIFSGCSDSEEREYVGKNSIYIRTEEDPVILEWDNEPLKATLMLIRAYDKDVSLEIDVKYLTEGVGDVVTVNPAVVTIPAGEKSVDFEIVSNQKGELEDKVYLEIGVKYPLPEADMGKVEEVLRIVVKPYIELEDLTEEQQALLEGYKAKGLDLTKWIGVIPVKVSVDVPPTDALESLISGMKREYTGKTVITLSEHATAEQPILKMTDNPMGLTEFLYDILRKETVENNTYWYYDPGEGYTNPYMAMMEIIGLSKTSLETFETTLNNIRVNMPVNGVSNVEFLGERPNIWDETEMVTIVPFVYDYSAWNRLKEALDTGENELLQEYVEQGATLDPVKYLFYSAIDEDYWEDGNWIEPQGMLTGNKLTFQFNFDHVSASGYSIIRVEYTLPE